VIFAHSLASDWNHGHAHFLRGVTREILAAGHEVAVYEPQDAWSVKNLRRDHGEAALGAYASAYPALPDTRHVYDPDTLDVDSVLRGADLAIVQEWNPPALVERITRAAAADGGVRTYFHDAHHRSVTAPQEIEAFGVAAFDAVLAFGDVVRDRYLAEGWATRAFTWHEAADTEVFHPHVQTAPVRDLVWIGNWGDEERTREFNEYLLEPVRRTGMTGTVHGVRYPQAARAAVEDAGLRYRGYLPNHQVPVVFGGHRITLHLPRRAYRERLPGIPTIRVFEALACGIPLVSLPWEDREGLFRPGLDFVVAHDGDEMAEWLEALCDDEDLRRAMARSGLDTIERRHTCRHRVAELMRIDRRLRGGQYPVTPSGSAPKTGPTIAFFGSSLVSSYWNGAATYYRGLLHALARRGCDITFYEPDAYDRQAHRDMADPGWARVVVYPAGDEADARRAVEQARGADFVVKASGVGVHDALLEEEVLRLQATGSRVLFWDVDAPATLARVQGDPDDPFRALIPQYDFVFTYGGGPRVVAAYEELGARGCVPVYNALDPETHHPVPRDPRFAVDLAFLGNRLPDREERVDEFFLRVAAARASSRFLLGGMGWADRPLPSNVTLFGHVPTREHNAFNASPRAVLNIHRESMARTGWSPATRVFEAAGAGACIITDHSEGIEEFFAPGEEILVAANGGEVARILDRLDTKEARRIGARARRRVLADHTYEKRAEQVMTVLAGLRRAVVA
jgi:spore maturation protein CgeB